MAFSILFSAADRLRAVLGDPARRERAVLLSLAAYVVLWTVYGAIAKSAQGLHPDMTELVAWSRDLSLGYLKHPPLAAWLVAGWFSVFPVAAWSYYLLAMLMPAIALWFAWRLSADYLGIEKRIVGLALLTLIPFFNFHALKFNVNTVLLPLWAATTFWFLRSYRTRSQVYAALAGLGAAGCMLGKYWSVFLLAGLALAAAIDARRADYFRSAAPWITIAVGLAVLSPHLIWLMQNNFAPLGYAMIVHGEKPLAATALSALGYLAGSFGYIAAPLVVTAIFVLRSNIRLRGSERILIADMIWPSDRERRLLALAFWLPLLLPALGAVIGKSEITSLWSMPAFTLLPVLLLSQPAVHVRPVDAQRILLVAIAVPLIMLLASPLIAIMAQRGGPQPASAQARLLAVEVERLWHETTPQRLRFVGGDADLAYAVVSFASDRPRALTDMRAPDAAELARAGQAIVCFAEDAGCRRNAGALAARVPGSQTIETTIVRNFLLQPGRPQRYSLVMVPPRG